MSTEFWEVQKAAGKYSGRCKITDALIATSKTMNLEWRVGAPFQVMPKSSEFRVKAYIKNGGKSMLAFSK